MEKQIIQEYIFPDNKDKDFILNGCDFHLEPEKNNNFITSCIPSTLKQESIIFSDKKYLPYLILFYFNHHKEVLEKWQALGKSFPENNGIITLDNSVTGPLLIPGQNQLQQINIRCVNLDYEKKLYSCFKNLNISNPFYWAKIRGEEKNYFILFYYNTFPAEFYYGPIDKTKIKEKYYKDGTDNYYSRFLVSTTPIGRQYLEKKKEEKFKVFDSLRLKGKYFKALEDNKPYDGIIKGKYYEIVEIKPGEFKVVQLYNY